MFSKGGRPLPKLIETIYYHYQSKNQLISYELIDFNKLTSQNITNTKRPTKFKLDVQN
ncbi:hypothetical protein Hanom_Chr10g00927481 [Helianthus anomalus]